VNPHQQYSPSPLRLDEEKKTIVLEYMSLVRFVAQRIWDRLPNHVDIRDLEHAGMLGLMEAVCRYDASQNNLFKTYAEHRIRGAILDELRKNDWMTRTGREKYKLLERTIWELEKTHRREVTCEEIAAALGMEIEKYFSFLNDVETGVFCSLEEMIHKREYREKTDIEMFSAAERKLWLEQVTKILADEIDRLRKDEHIMLSLYYYDELTLKEIGKVLGLTESRICQIHNVVMERLTRRLKKRIAVYE
jgi:RNA polymerase sigma factor for flagellar operon FliA